MTPRPTPARGDERLASPGPRTALAAVLDIGVVSAFALAGRRSHDEALTLDGWWQTAWPFLAGLAIGWVLVASTSGTYPTRLWHGLSVWPSTVLAGMALRDWTGQGTAWPFVVVATLVLAAGLIGWRAVTEILDRRAAGRERAARPPRERPEVQHTPVGDPLGLDELGSPASTTKGRGVVPPEHRERFVAEQLHDPRRTSEAPADESDT